MPRKQKIKRKDWRKEAARGCGREMRRECRGSE
jgi:hypothetical protein